jgi:hypothetical protein
MPFTPGAFSKILGYAKAALPTAATDGTYKAILTDLYGRLRLANEDVAANAVRMEEVDPLSAQHVEEAYPPLVNIASGTTAYLYWDMDGWRSFALQFLISGTDTCTVTVEGTVQDDGTAPAACTYIDLTLVLFGVANTTTSTMWVADITMPVKYMRVKYVTAGGANDADLTVFLKKVY